jgi:hypothetical protein
MFNLAREPLNGVRNLAVHLLRFLISDLEVESDMDHHAMTPSTIITLILAAAAQLTAQDAELSVGILAPGVNYSTAALQVYRAAAEASKINPNSSWAVDWTTNIPNFPQFITWNTIISDIPAPLPKSDLGELNANYSAPLNFTNTQIQLSWDDASQNDGMGLYGNSSLQEILESTNTTLSLDIFTAYLPASALSDYTNLLGGYCSWLSPECREELTAAARKSALLPDAELSTGSLPNCSQQLGDVSATQISKSSVYLSYELRHKHLLGSISLTHCQSSQSSSRRTQAILAQAMSLGTRATQSITAIPSPTGMAITLCSTARDKHFACSSGLRATTL